MVGAVLGGFAVLVSFCAVVVVVVVAVAVVKVMVVAVAVDEVVVAHSLWRT